METRPGREPQTTCEILIEAATNLKDGEGATVIADSGGENVNHEVGDLFGLAQLRRILGQVEVGYSNSMIARQSQPTHSVRWKIQFLLTGSGEQPDNRPAEVSQMCFTTAARTRLLFLAVFERGPGERSPILAEG